jgi:hypothetical protein
MQAWNSSTEFSRGSEQQSEAMISFARELWRERKA